MLSSSISYDADGNLLNDTFHKYTWDSYGHPLTIGGTSGTVTCGTSGTCLTYDAFGRMVEKNVSGTFTQILYSPVGKTATMSGQSTTNAYFPLPAGETLFETGSTGGNRFFWHKDWLGTVRFESNMGTRASANDRAFAPFGEMYNNFGTTGNLSFTGDTQDTISGMFDTPNRELHPSQGRWISPDPAGLGAVDWTNPQSWNRYGYVGNNPLSFVDPLGLMAGMCGSRENLHCGSDPAGQNAAMGMAMWNPFNIWITTYCREVCEEYFLRGGADFLFGWWLSGQYGQLPTNVYNALWNALKALRQKQLSQQCIDKVLNPLGVSATQFQNFLNQNPQFYSGPTSTVPIYGNVVQTGVWNWLTTPGTTVAENFGPGDTAMTLPGASSLVTFVAPQAIDTSNFGANVANESMLFHESLHGISGDGDNALQSLLLGSAGVDLISSMNVTDFIADQCF